MTPQEALSLYKQCSNVLVGRHPQTISMREKFLRLADFLGGDEYSDKYGKGTYIREFEKEVATLLGKESAVFMPSGTMAQLCALRIHCENQKNHRIALHPTSHLEGAELAAYLFVHNLHRIPFSAPELLRGRMLKRSDFEGLHEPPGAILIELPYRTLGFSLPSFSDLLDISSWARQKGIPLHMDGARLWQTSVFYQKSYQDIAALFDSVYVSFYKDLGGHCGAMLLGTEDFVQRARRWQRRHGGNLFTQDFNVVSARLGFQTHLSSIPLWVEQAQKIAKRFSEHPKIRVYPSPPHTSSFRIYLEGDAKTLLKKHHQHAAEFDTFVFFWLDKADVPGFCVGEIQCVENSLSFDIEKGYQFLSHLLKSS